MVFIKNIMTKNVLSMKKDDLIVEAAKKMAKRKVSCVVVTNDDKIPIGIITERDITRKLVAKGIPYSNIALDKIMTKPLKTIEDNVDFLYANDIMRKYKIRRLPVVHNRKLIGIVTQTDILNSSVRFIDKISEELKQAINNL